MAPKVGRKFKTKANRNTTSSSFSALVDRFRFPIAKTEQIFVTLTKYRFIWGERQLVPDELDPSIRRNLVSRNQGSSCEVSHSSPAALIREFYSNLFVYSEDTGGHYLTSQIRGKEYRITKRVFSEILGVPLVCRPTLTYTESPPLDDVMSLLYGRSISWGFEPRINLSELIEVKYLFIRIACHNIFPISHIHTIPLDRSVFLYAFITDGFMCFPSLFIQTIVEVYRKVSLRHIIFYFLFLSIGFYSFQGQTAFLPLSQYILLPLQEPPFLDSDKLK